MKGVGRGMGSRLRLANPSNEREQLYDRVCFPGRLGESQEIRVSKMVRRIPLVNLTVKQTERLTMLEEVVRRSQGIKVLDTCNLNH